MRVYPDRQGFSLKAQSYQRPNREQRHLENLLRSKIERSSVTRLRHFLNNQPTAKMTKFLFIIAITSATGFAQDFYQAQRFYAERQPTHNQQEHFYEESHRFQREYEYRQQTEPRLDPRDEVKAWAKRNGFEY
jgi:hypothetical protein